jgi:hypothetical protein
LPDTNTIAAKVAYQVVEIAGKEEVVELTAGEEFKLVGQLLVHA